MKQYLFAALSVATVLSAYELQAQTRVETKKDISKEETVIIKRDGDANTVIEIKNGSVYVNGDPVVTVKDGDATKVRKKIIIENGSGGNGNEHGFTFSPPFTDADGPEDEAAAPPRKAMLGVMTDPKDELGGALVKEVSPGSPAEQAGLKAGDRIMRVDSKSIADAAMLSAEVGSKHAAGDKVAIEYQRDGKKMTAEATLKAAPPRAESRTYHFNNPGGMQGGQMPNSFFREFRFPGMNGEAMAMDDARPKIGVSVEDRADGSGVTVLGVTPASAAAKAGLREGDVITKVGDEKIESSAMLQDKIGDSKPGERISLKYQRNGKDANADIVLPRVVTKRDL